MTLRVRIFLGIVLVQLASAALILGWYFYSLQAELSALTRNSAQEAVLRSIEATEDYFIPAETVAQAGQYLLAANLIGFDRPEQLEAYFFAQLRLWPQIAGLYVGYPDGAFFYVMRSDQETTGGFRTKIIRQESADRAVELIWRDEDEAVVKTAQDPEDPYDPRKRSWYLAAVERRGKVWTDPYIFFTSRKPGITLASPVLGTDGQVAAVFGVDIEMGEISSFLTRNSLGLRGSAFIATSEGEVIAHSSADLVTPDNAAGDDSLRFRKISELGGIEGRLGERVLARFSQTSETGPASVWEEASDDGDHFVAVGQMSKVNWPWQLVVTAPKTGQLEVGRTTNLILIGVILVATALACLVGYALSHKAGALLKTLHRNAVLARNGNIELMAEMATGDKEIDETAAVLYDLGKQRRQEGSSS